MEKNSFLKKNKIYLRELQEADINDEYLKWLNDYEVVKYTESRFFPHSLESLSGYLENLKNNSNVMFAIIEVSKDKHIGNIKLGNINWIHRTADIGIIIGNKDYWGKGVATESISLVVDYAFKRLNLRKITAGAYINNIGSIKAFKKNSFIQSYIEKNKCFYDGKYVDCITLELVNKMI